MIKRKEPKLVTIMGLPTRRFVKIIASNQVRNAFYIYFTQPTSLGTQTLTWRIDNAVDAFDAFCEFQERCAIDSIRLANTKYLIREEDADDPRC